MVLAAVGQQGNSHTQFFPSGERPPKGALKSVAVNARLSTATVNWTCVQTIIRSANCRNARPGTAGYHPRWLGHPNPQLNPVFMTRKPHSTGRAPAAALAPGRALKLDFVTIARCTIRLRHPRAADSDPLHGAKSSNTLWHRFC